MSLFSVWDHPSGLYPSPRHPGVGGMLTGGITIGIHKPYRSRTQCCCPKWIRLILRPLVFLCGGCEFPPFSALDGNSLRGRWRLSTPSRFLR